MYTFPHQMSGEKRAAPEDAWTQRKSLKATGLQKPNCIWKEKLTTDRKLLATRHGWGKQLWGEELGFPLQTLLMALISVFRQWQTQISTPVRAHSPGAVFNSPSSQSPFEATAKLPVEGAGISAAFLASHQLGSHWKLLLQPHRKHQPQLKAVENLSHFISQLRSC